jgi:hypothetical protein
MAQQSPPQCCQAWVSSGKARWLQPELCLPHTAPACAKRLQLLCSSWACQPRPCHVSDPALCLMRTADGSPRTQTAVPSGSSSSLQHPLTATQIARSTLPRPAPITSDRSPHIHSLSFCAPPLPPPAHTCRHLLPARPGPSGQPPTAGRPQHAAVTRQQQRHGFGFG